MSINNTLNSLSTLGTNKKPTVRGAFNGYNPLTPSSTDRNVIPTASINPRLTAALSDPKSLGLGYNPIVDAPLPSANPEVVKGMNDAVTRTQNTNSVLGSAVNSDITSGRVATKPAAVPKKTKFF